MKRGQTSNKRRRGRVVNKRNHTKDCNGIGKKPINDDLGIQLAYCPVCNEKQPTTKNVRTGERVMAYHTAPPTKKGASSSRWKGSSSRRLSRRKLLLSGSKLVKYVRSTGND